MLDDNLNIRKLKEIIGEARFENPTQFKDFLKPQLLQHLALRNRRLVAEPQIEKGRYDLQIFDSLTNLETLLLIGLKTAKDTPQLTAKDIEDFQNDCRALLAPYGALITETEVHFYEFKYEFKKGILIRDKAFEIEGIRPLNHIDAEIGRVLDKKKIKNLLISRKKIVIAVILVLILLTASNLAQNSICKSSGAVKGEIKSTGEKVYFLPTSPGYNGRNTGDVKGERRFCTEAEAEDAGFTKAK